MPNPILDALLLNSDCTEPTDLDPAYLVLSADPLDCENSEKE